MALNDLIRWNNFFILALLYNLSLLIVNRFFTNNRLSEVYPEVFSKFGQMIIILFGFIFYFSFISCRTRELFILFAIEKFLYFLSGVYWMMYRSHSVKFNSSPIEWLFMRVYWIGDLMFGVGFFIYFNQNN